MESNTNDRMLRGLSSELAGTLRRSFSRSGSQGSQSFRQIVPVNDRAIAHAHQVQGNVDEVDLEQGAQWVPDEALQAQAVMALNGLEINFIWT
jgi:hypothetical protein